MKLGAASSYSKLGVREAESKSCTYTTKYILEVLVLLLGISANRPREWIKEALESGQDFLSIYV